MKNSLGIALLRAALPLLLALSSVTAASGAVGGQRELKEEVQDVQVTNFPSTQNVKGSVSIDGVVSHAKSTKREGVLVPTSSRDNSNELINAGVVETDGFTSLSISLQGEVKSNNFVAGTIGVILIPDEFPILRVLRDRKLIQFPIECAYTVKAGDSEYFSALQCHDRIAFPRYRMYFYNTVNTTVEANVYLYLSN